MFSTDGVGLLEYHIKKLKNESQVLRPDLHYAHKLTHVDLIPKQEKLKFYNFHKEV